MFPRCLYVAKDTNYKELSDMFNFYYPDTETCVPDEEEWFKKNIFGECLSGTVWLVENKTNKNVGYIVVINNGNDDFSAGACAHEASHILTHFETWLGLDRSSQEYRAYMTEWFTDRIAEVWNMKEEEATNGEENAEANGEEDAATPNS